MLFRSILDDPTAGRVRGSPQVAEVSDYCAVPGAGDVNVRCPRCNHSGDVVGAAPVRAHRTGVVDGPWRYCSNVACPVVFFLDDSVVDQNVVVARVGLKATSKPIPVCFCFAHTIDDLAADLRDHDGLSTIKSEVKAAVADGKCACEYLNPTRTCCLADIHRAVKQFGADRVPQRGPDDAMNLIAERS